MDLKIKDVAELLHVSETTIRRWLSEGKIPAYKLNHQFRFDRIEIEDWMRGCKMGGAKPSERGTQQFSLFRAIHRGLVLSNVLGEEKEPFIQNAMKEIGPQLGLDAEVVTDLLLDRERMMPTSLNHGIAVPHAREVFFRQPYDVILIAFPKVPLDWGALDNLCVHTVFFLFACEDKRHLHLLAKLAHLASDPEALQFLKSKPNKEALLEYIKNWESELAGKEVTCFTAHLTQSMVQWKRKRTSRGE